MVQYMYSTSVFQITKAFPSPQSWKKCSISNQQLQVSVRYSVTFQQMDTMRTGEVKAINVFYPCHYFVLRAFPISAVPEIYNSFTFWQASLMSANLSYFLLHSSC